MGTRSISRNASPQRRAIGIVRVSEVKGREGDRFVSPHEQRARIEATCAREGIALLDVYDEMDVSGGRALAQRPGLNAAVAAVEAGETEVVVAAYFDRLFRSLSTQAEVIERVECAGGQVLAVDVGPVTNGSAGQWLSGTMLGAVSEYQRRSIRERSAEGQARAVARGATPWARVPLGYVRQDGTLTPDRKAVPIVQRAFEMRAEGASIARIRAMLKSRGIDRSHRGVQVMLGSRVYLGEIHFGKLVNLNAHEPLIDRELWSRVQGMVIARGPRAASDRLLARQGVLRCGSCGARLSVMTVKQKPPYPIYRCASTSDCDHHVVISAEIAEEVVTEAVRTALADAQGRASTAENAQRAAAALDHAQADLDAALRAFAASGLEAEPAAVERLAELRQARDDAQAQLDRLGADAARTVSVATDWDKLSLAGRRDLIRATVKSAVVAPSGRGAGRITVQLFGE